MDLFVHGLEGSGIVGVELKWADINSKPNILFGQNLARVQEDEREEAEASMVVESDKSHPEEQVSFEDELLAIEEELVPYPETLSSQPSSDSPSSGSEGEKHRPLDNWSDSQSESPAEEKEEPSVYHAKVSPAKVSHAKVTPAKVSDIKASAHSVTSSDSASIMKSDSSDSTLYNGNSSWTAPSVSSSTGEVIRAGKKVLRQLTKEAKRARRDELMRQETNMRFWTGIFGGVIGAVCGFGWGYGAASNFTLRTACAVLCTRSFRTMMPGLYA